MKKFLTIIFILLFFSPFIIKADSGDLDLTFNTTGTVTTDINGNALDQINGLAVQTDGKIVAVGYTSSGNEDIAVVRYNTDGSLDTSFNDDGIATFSPSSGISRANDVIILDDGSMILAGLDETDASGDDNIDFLLLKIDSTGSLDTSFGTNGVVTTDFGRPTDGINKIAIDSDGKIVAVGFSANSDSTSSDLALARYVSDGSLDRDFLSNGKVTLDVDDIDFGTGVKIMSDETILVSGSAENSANTTENALLARYNSDGTLDSTFGTKGITETSGGGTVMLQVTGLGIQSDGKIVIGGTRFPSAGADGDFFVARYTDGGTLDTSFGSNGTGMVNTDVNGDDIGQAMLVQSDDKIVVGGSDADDMAVARFNSDGSLDNAATFSSDGIQAIDFPDSDTDQGFAVAIQSDGKILIGGSAGITAGNTTDFGLARLESNIAEVAMSGFSASAPNQVVGTSFTYTVSINNNGPDDIDGITITGTLPSEISYDSASADSGTVTCLVASSVLTCVLSTLANGSGVNVILTVTPTAAGNPVTLTLTASVLAEDADATNNTRSVDVNITAASSGGGCSLVRY